MRSMEFPDIQRKLAKSQNHDLNNIFIKIFQIFNFKFK